MNFKKILSLLCCSALCLGLSACTLFQSGGTGGPADGNSAGGGSAGGSSVSGGEITDGNEVEITEPDSAEHDFTLISGADGTYVFGCADCGSEATVTVTCVSGTPNAYSVVGNTITFADIAEDSVYDVSGVLYGNIVIDVSDDYEFELQMSGFELNSDSYCPISISGGKKVTLSAKKSTVNYVNDLREAVDETDADAVSASVYALCDLDIQGKGNLYVTSVNNNGIHTKDDLNVKNLSLQVDCMDNALKGNDSVTIEGGTLILIARQGDGIKTTNSDVSSKGNQRGTVAVEGGDILIYAACDGIDAAYDVVIDESSASLILQIFTDKYSKYSEEVTAVSDSVYYIRYNSAAYSYSLKFYNDDDDAVWCDSSSYTTVGNFRYYPITKPSGYSYVKLYIYRSGQQQGQGDDYYACTDELTVNDNYDTIALQQNRNGGLSYGWTNYTTSQTNPSGNMGNMGNMGGMNDGNTDKGDYSTKGIKAANAVSVSAGTVTISAYDDAVHANCDSTLENGESPLGNVTLSGGNLTLRSNDDAVHADNVVSVTGGTISVVSSYEGIEGYNVNISGGDTSVISSDDGVNGTAASGTAITVSGGKLYVCAGGDGVDSNSTSSRTGINFSGGYSVIINTSSGNSCIDTENGYKYTGGYVVGIMPNGGMTNEATNCSNLSSVGTTKTVSLQKDAYLVVSGVVTVKMPASVSAFVVCLGKQNASISSATSTDYGLDANGVYWNV